MLFLRVLHVGLGVFWAGTVIFMGLFMGPALRAAGPAGGAVMRELQAKKYATVMPIAAIATILTGIELLRRAVPGGPMAWVASPTGLTFTIGGLAATIAFVIGLTFVLPRMKRVAALAPLVAGGTATAEQAAEAQRITAQMVAITRLITTLLIVAVLAMAVARYM